MSSSVRVSQVNRQDTRKTMHPEKYDQFNYHHNPDHKVLPREEFTGSVRVMTYNLHGFIDLQKKKRYEEIIEIVKLIDPDIVVFEEVWLYKKSDVDAEKLIKDLKATKLKYYKFSKSGINAVFSKYPFVSRELDLGRDPVIGVPRNAIICEFLDLKLKGDDDTNLKMAKLANTVVVGAHLDVFDETGVTRKNQMASILKDIDDSKEGNSKRRVIVTGDFNSLRKADYTVDEWNYLVDVDKRRGVTTIEDAVPVIEKAGYVESFTNCGKQLKNSVWSGRRVDYIFGKNIQFKQCSEYRVTYSDHYPVYCDM
ncbi:exodeoxyribonuclease III [Yasminevirus sp. GU-2018]|uniref:Exodeoxyribonuclease III n=1 Tax=Yasminevirus sp. GU-2018 TaxID=2420051 RepID=A0A5K0UAJ6_9VIRU|nr:exodeoxyribonuclease III [Yasminevirus sp. GU-2018]